MEAVIKGEIEGAMKGLTPGETKVEVRGGTMRPLAGRSMGFDRPRTLSFVVGAQPSGRG